MRFWGAPLGDVYVEGKKVKLDPSASIGKGGEADVFNLGNGIALKLFKGPNHPDLVADPAAAEAAAARIDQHQAKLPLFPRNLPPRVIAPKALATDKSGAKICGYTMPLVEKAEVLYRYSESGFRKAVDGNMVASMLVDLLETVERLHSRGVVVGDFNDLNVLVRGTEAYLIDADSFQYGGFSCSVYSERFLDPLLADPKGTRPVQVKPFEQASDWYAFAVLAMQTLLAVGPYGGVYKPRSANNRVTQDARPLHRITVMDADVVYPKPALPLTVLPDDLLHTFYRIFREDDRRPFPRWILQHLAWKTCPVCALSHARNTCPRCQNALNPVGRVVESVKGTVSRKLVRETGGRVVIASLQAGVLRYLIHENGAYVREDGRKVLQGTLKPDWHFALCGDETLIVNGADAVAIGGSGAVEQFPVDVAGGEPSLACNGGFRFRVDGGRLLRRGKATGKNALLEGEETRFGDVLPGQTKLWVGDHLGFGLYRAGGLNVAFVFNPTQAGMIDTVKLNPLPGQILGYRVVFGDDRVWVFWAVRTGGRTVHQSLRVKPDGEVDATARAEEGDGSWLGSLRGKCAVGRSLLSATDLGLVRVEVDGSEMRETRRFADSEPYVTSASDIFAAREGVYTVDAGGIFLLTQSGS